MFWADEITEEILKKYPDKDSFLINDSTTPSGHAHFGSLRGVIIHNLICRGLLEKNKKAIFQFGFEDFDPMDGLPVYVDSSFDKYMGMPLCNIPAPDGKSENFAEQYTNELQSVFNKLGIHPEIVKTSELYRQGKFNEAIKIILDNASAIIKLYKDISGSDKGGDWYPFQVVCPKCGKIGTTVVIGWNGKVVKFKCEENLVEWAKGCGEEGEISPFDGNGKLPWKVEWPSKWYITNTDIEGEGKDHFAAGGTRDIANAIFRQIFKKEPPYDIRYEHLLIGGAKMSSSKGLGVTAKDMSELLPANILKFLFTRTKYKKALEFNPEGETIPLLYDEYDRCAAEYVKNPKSDFGRAYYYAEIDTDKSQSKYLLRFSKIAYMLQMPRSDIFEYAEKEKQSKLTVVEKEEIENRIAIAKVWLEKFAPEKYKFVIYEKLPNVAQNLSKVQKDFLQKIAEIMESKEWTGPKWAPFGGEDLHKEIHDLQKQMNISPRDAFSSIYLLFLGKDSGPQAGWLLASLDKEFIINRLKEVLK